MTVRILKNAAKCKNCGDVIESTDTQRFKRCECGKIYVDGGTRLIRRGGPAAMIENMNEYDQEFLPQGQEQPPQ